MKSNRFQSITVTVVTTFMLGTLPAYGQLNPAAHAEIEQLQKSPDSAGFLIYRGDTFAQRSSSGMPLYRYERRVSSSPNTISATHLTSDLAGKLIIVESATSSPIYELQHLHVADEQSGYSGSVAVSNNGRHLEFQLDDNGKVSSATEDVFDDVVSGTSLFGFILNKWDVLKSGSVIPVRMIVMRDKTTYGFDLRFEKQMDQQVSFSVIPSSFLIRQIVAPLRVVFDATTKNPIRYEGRVPPMEVVSGKLKSLDARVTYKSLSPKNL